MGGGDEGAGRQVRKMGERVESRDILDELARAYVLDRSLSQFGHPVSAHQYLKLYRLIAKYAAAGGKVLDWGAGNGHFSYFLVRRGYKATGFDFAGPPPVCSSFGPDQYVFKGVGAVGPSAIPFESESFDAVAGIGVLEHVAEAGGAESASLAEIGRVLKPGGVFLCYHLPNRYSWIEAGLRLLRRWSHRNRYTARHIMTLAESAGFTVVEIGQYAILPRNMWSRGRGAMPGKGVYLARLYDTLDDVLSKLLPVFCQNYLFVARKKGPHP